MAGGGPVSRAVSRLDAAVGRSLEGTEAPILAFSGGLASLVVAALARKRCELRCVVVGFRGSADVEAALVARDFLDHRITILRPTQQEAFRAARSLAAADPQLPLADLLALVPLTLVETRHPRHRVLSGFGVAACDAPLRRSLQPRRRWCPGLGVHGIGSTRAPLRRIAEAIGLPESFVLAAPRNPVDGSGIGPVLRRMAHVRQVSLARLVASDGLVPDYHERLSTPDNFKSLDVD